MTCLSSDHKYLFIAGGITANTQHDDLIVYDLTKGRLNIYRDIMRVSNEMNANSNPILAGQFMIEMNGDIYIFGDSVYKIQKIFKPQEICFTPGMLNSWYGGFYLYSRRTHFSFNSTIAEGGIDVFVFGGKTLANSILDDLYIIHIPNNVNNQIPMAYAKVEKPRRGERDWPSARFGHSSCIIANLMFVYGGMSAKNQLLNDLYVFDTSTRVWTEINVESMLPPYTGTIILSNSKEVNQFLEFVKLVSEVKHFPYIQKICSMDLRKDLSLTREILEVMHKDFTSLIDDKTYSDLVIVLDHDGSNQPPPMEEISMEDELLSPLSDSKIPSSGIFVHKLIVSRSPFFARMFVTSGMLESKEKVVHLTDYSKEIMMDLLKYLYTDIIQLSPRNCLGILVYCLMLDLGDLASCCRRMVSSLVDNNNVWTIHEIAVLYNEKTLECSCEQYIANNYATLSTNSFFLELPDMSRIKIKQIYDRKNKKK
ncbi:predicted protein [Naegleria gruberi]|uniref:Predicted protein n=1 Tax=Naegleria gruberi TaxID=5762 RepID=D2VHW5_NAEGR|nr:uncharacterized protein NAEGRDRAFT_68469 [Naegleria gruberi]EFC43665.1 predicted protein [Naegleria gruberi]|eukprot:XP_002676409.1 predicted protein [Naegleria gruberi strain NEG-M]